jgi:hypothetical protein
MPGIASRSRLVSFRLTAEEHELLKQRCAGVGGRSVSQFARTSLLQQSKMGAANFGDDLATMSARLWELNRTLYELSSLIERLLGIDQVPETPDSVNIRMQRATEQKS